RWPSFPGTQGPSRFLPGELPNDHASDSSDNTPVCERNSHTISSSPHSDRKSLLAQPVTALRSAAICLRDTDTDPARHHTKTHWAAVDAELLSRWAFPHAPCFPENRSLARPSSRCCLAWYSRHRPPSVAAFSPAALRCDPLPATTARCRSLPASPRLPQSAPVPHRQKSARCSSAIIPHPSGASLLLADRCCSPAPRSWPFLRSCAPATFAVLAVRSP